MTDLEKEYLEVASQKTKSTEIIAIYYKGKEKIFSYFLLEMGNAEQIKEKIGNGSDGQALNLVLGDRYYWILMSKDQSRNFILFRRDKNGEIPFFDVAPDEHDIDAMKYIATL